MPSKFLHKEFIVIIATLLLLNFASVYIEDLSLIRWSRLLTSVVGCGYLVSRYKIYLISRFLLGTLLLVLTDVFYIYLNFTVTHLLYLIASTAAFLLFVVSINKFINWKSISKTTILFLILTNAGLYYFLNYLLEIVVLDIEVWLLAMYNIYAIAGMIYCSITIISFLQVDDRTGNGNYLYISFGFLLSNTFLLVAFYSDIIDFYYLTRIFYLLVWASLIHLLGRRALERFSKLEIEVIN